MSRTVDWDNVPDSEGGYEPIPEGEYLVTVRVVTEEQTRSGKDCWKLKLWITEGPYKDKTIFDRLFFTEKALSRVKFVYSRFGLKTEGVGNIDTEDLVGRSAMVTVLQSKFIGDNGREQTGNEVPWDGYTAVDKKEDDDLPF